MIKDPVKAAVRFGAQAVCEKKIRVARDGLIKQMCGLEQLVCIGKPRLHEQFCANVKFVGGEVFSGWLLDGRFCLVPTALPEADLQLLWQCRSGLQTRHQVVGRNFPPTNACQFLRRLTAR